LVHYITTNAVHHGFCGHAREWEFCSYHAMQTERPTRLNTAFVLEHFSSLAQYQAVIDGPLPACDPDFEFAQ
jgi:hypothetical protein